jgi:hypothetical protein
MKQMSLSESGFERKIKRTRKREFLQEMNLVVPWSELVSLIAPHAPQPGTKGARPPFAVDTMLRIHCIQQWFNRKRSANCHVQLSTIASALFFNPVFQKTQLKKLILS